MYVFINNEIVDSKKAHLHVSDLSIHRGYGVFDFFKIENGHVYFMEDYLDRFYHSASVLRLAVPLEREELKKAIRKLIRKNSRDHGGVKLILTGGYSPDGYQPVKPNLIMTQLNIVLPSEDQVEKGVEIITHEYVRDLPEVKTINYSMGIWLLEKVKAANAYDVLYRKDNVVSEFPRSNFFIVTRDSRVVTPARDVLRGVTRKNVLRIASKKYQAVEEDISIDDVMNASEAFITSTTKRILPVVKVDGNIIGTGKPGPVSLSLLAELIQLEEQDLKTSR